MSPDDADRPPPEDAYATTSPTSATTQPGKLPTAHQATLEIVENSATPAGLPDAGYELGDLLGRGGMGEVIAARDRRIGREVALKRMTPSSGSARRFLREARIQARLDHPAIVPVHELGVDENGRPYFTMKRLSGVTLADRLKQPESMKPLLHAFVDVCLAIEFAHARGVIHRDLKPSNIMLGDYGEVYVLDWGIARVLRDRADSEIDDLAEEDRARPGELMGTPGYMAPEQLNGHDAGTATDVYALGAILFEILAGEPLHRGLIGMSNTLRNLAPLPERFTADRTMAPELEAACRAALVDEPASRLTARELANRVQRYLDGDRDVERRKSLAAEHLHVAQAAFESGDPENRATAMRSAGRALALDPESAEAARLVTALMVEPPHELPAALVAELDREDRESAAGRLRSGVMSLLAPFAFLVLFPWAHVESWSNLIGFYAAIGVMAAVNWSLYRRRRPSVSINLLNALVVSLAFSRILGPFALTPIALSGVFLAISANTWLNPRPWIVLGWLAVAMLAPFALEWAGVLDQTWKLSSEGVVSLPRIFTMGGSGDAIVLLIGQYAILAALVVFALRVSRHVTAARHELSIHAWHLRHLLPKSPVA